MNQNQNQGDWVVIQPAGDGNYIRHEKHDFDMSPVFSGCLLNIEHNRGSHSSTVVTALDMNTWQKKVFWCTDLLRDRVVMVQPMHLMQVRYLGMTQGSCEAARLQLIPQ